MERARGAFRHLKTMFQELEECRAFELLKVQPLPLADRMPAVRTARDDMCCRPTHIRHAQRALSQQSAYLYALAYLRIAAGDTG